MERNSKLAGNNPFATHSFQPQASSNNWDNESILALVAPVMMITVPLASWALKRWIEARHGMSFAILYSPFSMILPISYQKPFPLISISLLARVSRRIKHVRHCLSLQLVSLP